ncbi:hypothetical protein K2X89_02275, partial [Myxococcota bacterium]|nr:hypothetical protein [Myxococcota bacterium]
ADELLFETGLEPGEFATALLELELSGCVVEERDGRVHLCHAEGDRARGDASLRCAPPEPEENPP